jgi:hypothetical protein
MEQPFERFGFWPCALSEPEIGRNIHKSFFSFNNMTNEHPDFGHQNDSHLFLQPCRELSRTLGERWTSLKSIAYGTNGNRLEAYPTLRRCVAAVIVLPHDLELSLDAPKSNVA